MVRSLPRMIRYLKEHGTYVVFGTIGALLNRRRIASLSTPASIRLRIFSGLGGREGVLCRAGMNFLTASFATCRRSPRFSRNSASIARAYHCG